MELRDALLQISEMRRHLAETEKFRGYRALPVACGAAAAVVGAALQSWLVVDPANNLPAYLMCWVTVAAVSAVIPAIDVYITHSKYDELRTILAQLAFDQFCPCVIAGAMVTGVIAWRAPQSAWMLPGLWSVLFSLGMFASYRLMARSIALVATWYLLFGCVLLYRGSSAALEPWTMGISFGVGQALCAIVLARQPEE